MQGWPPMAYSLFSLSSKIPICSKLNATWQAKSNLCQDFLNHTYPFSLTHFINKHTIQTQEFNVSFLLLFISGSVIFTASLVIFGSGWQDQDPLVLLFFLVVSCSWKEKGFPHAVSGTMFIVLYGHKTDRKFCNFPILGTQCWSVPLECSFPLFLYLSVVIQEPSHWKFISWH